MIFKKKSARTELFKLPPHLIQKICQILVNCQFNDGNYLEQTFSKSSKDIINLLLTCKYLHSVITESSLSFPLKLQIKGASSNYTPNFVKYLEFITSNYQWKFDKLILSVINYNYLSYNYNEAFELLSLEPFTENLRRLSIQIILGDASNKQDWLQRLLREIPLVGPNTEIELFVAAGKVDEYTDWFFESFPESRIVTKFAFCPGIRENCSQVLNYFPYINELNLSACGSLNITDFKELVNLRKLKIDSLLAEKISLSSHPVYETVVELTLNYQRKDDIHKLPLIIEYCFPKLEFLCLHTEKIQEKEAPFGLSFQLLPSTCIAVEIEFRMLKYFSHCCNIEFMRVSALLSESIIVALPEIGKLRCSLRVLVYDCAYLPSEVNDSIIEVLNNQPSLEALCLRGGSLDKHKIKPWTRESYDIVMNHNVSYMIVGSEVALAKHSLNQRTVNCLNYLDYVCFWRIRQSHDLMTCLELNEINLPIAVMIY